METEPEAEICCWGVGWEGLPRTELWEVICLRVAWIGWTLSLEGLSGVVLVSVFSR